jgi:hypothetical protein
MNALPAAARAAREPIHLAMKKFLLLFAAIVFSAVTIPRAGAAISVSVFYDSLEPYGEWLEVADYGYVWHPADIDEQWQPYTVGHWVFTDAGWTWVSDEPYGWAVYHYGRWARVQPVGWVWVPETEWGPAWVSWRRSPRHVGWAPLPPEARFRRDVALSTWVDAYYDIGPTYYNFVEVRQFGAPRLREVLVPQRENITIINETRNITNITYTNNVVFNGGPEYDVIVRESAQPIRRLRLERITEMDASNRDRRDAWRPRVEGDALRVMAPPVDVAASVAPKKVARRIEKVEIDRGWKGIADQGQAQKLRAAIKSQAKVPPALPPQPKFEPIASRKDDKATTETSAAPTATAEATQPTPGTEAARKDGRGKAAAGTDGKPMRTADRPGGKGRAKTAADVGVDPNAAAATEDQKAATASPTTKTAGKAKKDAARTKAEAKVAAPGTDAAEKEVTGAPTTTTSPDAASAAVPTESKDKKMRRNGKEGRNVAAPDGDLPENSSVDRPDARAKTESTSERNAAKAARKAAKAEDDASKPENGAGAKKRDAAGKDDANQPPPARPERAAKSAEPQRGVPSAEPAVPDRPRRAEAADSTPGNREARERAPQAQRGGNDGRRPENARPEKRGAAEGAAAPQEAQRSRGEGAVRDGDGKRKKEKDAE